MTDYSFLDSNQPDQNAVNKILREYRDTLKRKVVGAEEVPSDAAAALALGIADGGDSDDHPPDVTVRDEFLQIYMLDYLAGMLRRR